MKRNAFTLIELLTVIAIIGILAAILIPTVGAVRKSARQTQSLSNLKQLGSAMLLYVNDNKGSFPALGRPPTPTWDVQVSPFAGGEAATKIMIADPNDEVERIPGGFKRSYGYNPVACAAAPYYVKSLGAFPKLYAGIPLSYIRNPAAFPLLLEEYKDYNVYGSAMAECTAGEAVRTIGGKPGSNVVYADGHVAFLFVDPSLPWDKWMMSKLANK